MCGVGDGDSHVGQRLKLSVQTLGWGWGPLSPNTSVPTSPPILQSALLAQNGTSSLPRNLAATLQDIETKRQLALQQKGKWL